MKVITKTILKVIGMAIVVMTVCIVVITIRHAYGTRLPDEDINEVAIDIYRGKSLPDVTYIERKVTSSNNAERYDIYVLNAWRTLQTCCIENGVLLNFRSLNSFDLGVYEGEATKTANKLIMQLPNVLQQDTESFDYPADIPAITIVKVFFSSEHPHPFISQKPERGNSIAWTGDWWALKWVGTPNEAPTEVEAFCQSMAKEEASHGEMRMDAFKTMRPRTARAAVALPDIRNYPSYLRAVPLITEEDLEATQDIPLIALEKTRLNVHYAVKAPYIFLPIPPKRSPFPTLKKFTPGDKVKVNYEGGSFLIETFANGSIGR